MRTPHEWSTLYVDPGPTEFTVEACVACGLMRYLEWATLPEYNPEDADTNDCGGADGILRRL